MVMKVRFVYDSFICDHRSVIHYSLGDNNDVLNSIACEVNIAVTPHAAISVDHLMYRAVVEQTGNLLYPLTLE